MKTTQYFFALLALTLALSVGAAETPSQQPAPGAESTELFVFIDGDNVYMSLETFKTIQSTLIRLTQALNRASFIIENKLNCVDPNKEKQITPLQPRRVPQNILPPL